jgi:hypothetical protein
MTPAEISIVTTRLLADIQALSKNVSDALNEQDVDTSRKAWRASADALGGVISDVATLAQNDSKWATLLGGASTVDALRLSYNKAFEAYTKLDNINDVKVGDMLGVMGGVSDLAGGILAKPGPQFIAGLALKGIGLGAAMGQNAVDDGLTIGQLIGASLSNTPTQSTSPMMEIVVTATRLDSADVTTPADAATRTSNNYISDTSANDHLVEIKTGGTLWDAYVLQKNTNNGFEDWSDFKSAVAASNPGIADLNNISAGTKLYVPEKFADGSITYNSADGTAINSNAATGEYQMVVQNADGGQTVYDRALNTSGTYTVYTIGTNKLGTTTDVAFESRMNPLASNDSLDQRAA